MNILHNHKYTCTAIAISIISSLFIACIGTATANSKIYIEEIDQLPPLDKNQCRLVFYGTNFGWYGFAAGGDWKPIITIDDHDIHAPNNRNIYFVLDLPAGEHKIDLKYPRRYLKKSTYGVPYWHDITQGYTLHANGGQTYFNEMTISTVRTDESFFHDFDYFLSLWRVKSDSALPILKRMQHWHKALEDQKNNDLEEDE